MYYVYAYLREDNTPYYIGKGKGSRAYANHPRKNGSNMLPKDINKIKILHENLSEDEPITIEQQLIQSYGRKDLGTGILLNMTDGGDGLSGWIRPQTAIDSHRSKLKGKPRPKEVVTKIALSNTGKKRSAETKQKLSESHKGKKQSEETKRKRAEKLKGIKRSEETKLKFSLSKMGEKNPMYGKPSPMLGKVTTEETKQKLREANIGKKDSEETRRKKSEAQKKRHAQNKLKYNK